VPAESRIKRAISKFWNYVSHAAVLLTGALVSDFACAMWTSYGAGGAVSTSGKWVWIELGAVLLWLLWNGYSMLIANLTGTDLRRVRGVDAFTWLPLALLGFHTHQHLIGQFFLGRHYSAAYFVATVLLVLLFKASHAAALLTGARAWAVAVLIAGIAGLVSTIQRLDFPAGNNIFSWFEVDVFIGVQLASAAIISLFVFISGAVRKRAARALKGAVALAVFLPIWLSFTAGPKPVVLPGPKIAEKMPEALPMEIFAKGGKVRRVRMVIGGELRDAVLFPQPGSVSQKLDIVPGSKLSFGIGAAVFGERPNDAVLTFSLDIERNAQKATIWKHKLDPLHVPSDRDWVDVTVDLSPLAGSESVLTFRVEGGPFGAVSRPVITKDDHNSDKPPNVLILLVDTLRDDHVGAWGYERNTTPFIDEIARTGAIFRKTVSTSSWTEPATFSLLTGMLPGQADVDLYGRVKIADKAEFLSEILHRKGYRTGAISGNYVISYTLGFDQGFETFSERCFSNFHWRSAECMTDEAIEWIDREPDRPFFLYLHYIDPHARYNAPPPYHEMFSNGYVGEDQRIKRGETMEFELMRQRADKTVTLPEEDRRYLLERYDGEIAYSDAQLRRLFDNLGKRGLLRNTIVVITSDHGEEFTEHGMLGHVLNLHGTLVNVPLVFRAEGRVPAGVVVNEPVSLADVMPTLLDMLEIEPPRMVWGRSVTRLWKGDRLEPRICFAQRRRLWFFEWAVTDGKHKLIMESTRKSGMRNPRFYDLDADPLEYNNLAGNSLQERRMREELMKTLGWINKNKIKFGGPADKLDEEKFRKRMKALGYL